MAKGLVYFFEVIQVEHQEARLAPACGTQVESLRDSFGQEHPIRQASQLVAVRRIPAFGDVGHHRQRTGEVAGLVEYRVDSK